MQCCISNSKQDASHVQKDEVVRAEDKKIQDRDIQLRNDKQTINLKGF